RLPPVRGRRGGAALGTGADPVRAAPGRHRRRSRAGRALRRAGARGGRRRRRALPVRGAARRAAGRPGRRRLCLRRRSQEPTVGASSEAGATPVRDRAIPEATIARLPVYLRSLVEMAERNTHTVSSEQLADAAGVNSAKVRKDLSYLGSYGTR